MRVLIKSLPVFCIAVFAACFILISASCNHDKCGSISCLNGGVCNSGSCTCATGYQGSNCATVSRSAFLGIWSSASNNSSVTEAAQYPVSITVGSAAINSIAIGNVLDYFTTPVSGYIINDNLYVPFQQLQGKGIQGSGSIIKTGTSTEIVISYDITDLSTNVTTNVTETLK